jgi:hypothetical protein
MRGRPQGVGKFLRSMALRINDDMLEEVRFHARNRGTTVQAYIRMAIENQNLHDEKLEKEDLAAIRKEGNRREVRVSKIKQEEVQDAEQKDASKSDREESEAEAIGGAVKLCPKPPQVDAVVPSVEEVKTVEEKVWEKMLPPEWSAPSEPAAPVDEVAIVPVEKPKVVNPYETLYSKT